MKGKEKNSLQNQEPKEKDLKKKESPFQRTISIKKGNDVNLYNNQ